MVGNNNRGEKFILFLINPFISAITSIKDIRDGVSHWFLYLWFLVFGVAFCAVSEAADSFRYVEDFLVEYSYTWSQYVLEINEYFAFESNIKAEFNLQMQQNSD